MRTKLILSALILIALPTLALVLNPTVWDRFKSRADLLERIGALEKSLESSSQQIQAYHQKESEYLQKISELQASNQQLENKHRRNLDELFK